MDKGDRLSKKGDKFVFFLKEVMKKKSKPKGRNLKPYVYRGFFYCGECGCFITTETQKGHNYLRCTKRKNPCSQRYTREEIITSQIKEEIKKVSLSSAWVDACVQELEKERTQEKQAESSFVLKLRNELIEIEQKLDSLLDLQLNGALSQDEYIAKKTKLLNQKIDISEKITASKQKSDNRFEPLMHFLKATNQAEKIALQENPEQGRDFLKKIGSNFHIAERTLAVDLKKPWRVARSWHSVSRSIAPHSAVSGKSENWRRGRDSNPWRALTLTRFPSEHLKPLSHLSKYYHFKLLDYLFQTEKKLDIAEFFLFLRTRSFKAISTH